MKKLNLFMIFSILLIINISCSSNTDKGEKAASMFCDAINNSSGKELKTKLIDFEKEFKKVEKEEEFIDAFYLNISCLKNKPMNLRAIPEIDGDFMYAFQIVKGEYPIKYKNGGFILRFPIEKSSEWYDELFYNYLNDAIIDYTYGNLLLFDKSNNFISKHKIYGNNGSKNVITNKTNKAWVEVPIRTESISKDGISDFIDLYADITNVKSFSIELLLKENKFEYNSSDKNESSDDSNSISDNDFDELLDSYEEFFEQYIALFKKAQRNDMSAISEYPLLLEKAEDLSRKIENARGQLTTEQLNRYLKIQQKFSEAATELYK